MKKFHHMREEFHPYLVYSLGNCGMKLYIDTTKAVSLTNPLADFHLSYVPGWHGHGRPLHQSFNQSGSDASKNR